jgi:hypothetical protein
MIGTNDPSGMLWAVTTSQSHFPKSRPATYCQVLIFGILLFVPSLSQAAQTIHYLVDLSATGSHLVQVTMNIPEASAGTEVQIPTWNALYQIRDFVKDVEGLKGECDGQAVALQREDLNTWRAP